MGHGRRKSVDSSSSSSSSGSEKGKKSKSEKKDKDGTADRGVGGSFPAPPAYTAPPVQQPVPQIPVDTTHIPSSGYRIPLTTTAAFPYDRAGQAPCLDLDGKERLRVRCSISSFARLGSPVFLGSALLQGSVHPCKIVAHFVPPCLVSH